MADDITTLGLKPSEVDRFRRIMHDFSESECARREQDEAAEVRAKLDKAIKESLDLRDEFSDVTFQMKVKHTGFATRPDKDPFDFVALRLRQSILAYKIIQLEKDEAVTSGARYNRTSILVPNSELNKAIRRRSVKTGDTRCEEEQDALVYDYVMDINNKERLFARRQKSLDLDAPLESKLPHWVPPWKKRNEYSEELPQYQERVDDQYTLMKRWGLVLV